MLLALVGLSTGIRVRSYLVTRKIQAVLAGLQQLKVDTTKEEELSRMVPYLVREPVERREDTHLLHFYRAVFSNLDDYYRWQEWVPKFVSDLWPARIVEPDVFMGWPIGTLVSVHTIHGFSRHRKAPLWISSDGDESPYFRFGPIAGEFSWIHGKDASIGVAYTADAPREKVSHVYQVDLSCFWSFRGCNSVRQVVPLLWKDQQEIPAATAARLARPIRVPTAFSPVESALCPI